jgi:hypothetical protein
VTAEATLAAPDVAGAGALAGAGGAFTVSVRESTSLMKANNAPIPIPAASGHDAEGDRDLPVDAAVHIFCLMHSDLMGWAMKTTSELWRPAVFFY